MGVTKVNDQEIVLYILGLIVMLVVVTLFKKPVKFILKLVVNTFLGGLALMLLNTFGSAINLSIGVNPITAFTCGVLGLPGFVLLIIIKLLFG